MLSPFHCCTAEFNTEEQSQRRVQDFCHQGKILLLGGAKKFFSGAETRPKEGRKLSAPLKNSGMHFSIIKNVSSSTSFLI